MGSRLIKISAIYFVIGVSLGLYMSIVHSYVLTSVHVHINLLGWVSLALAGIIYTLFPDLASTKLAKIHFWLHNITLPIMMLGLCVYSLWPSRFNTSCSHLWNHFSSCYYSICFQYIKEP